MNGQFVQSGPLPPFGLVCMPRCGFTEPAVGPGRSIFSLAMSLSGLIGRWVPISRFLCQSTCGVVCKLTTAFKRTFPVWLNFGLAHPAPPSPASPRVEGVRSIYSQG
jgi:hypothetical protein